MVIVMGRLARIYFAGMPRLRRAVPTSHGKSLHLRITVIRCGDFVARRRPVTSDKFAIDLPGPGTSDGP